MGIFGGLNFMTEKNELHINFPGKLVKDFDIVKRIVEKLEFSFSIPPSHQRKDTLPIRTYFTNAQLLENSEINYDAIRSKNLFFYVEPVILRKNVDCLYQATAKQIECFFESRNPWECFDSYIFDTSYNWCIAATHDDQYWIAYSS